MDKVPGIKKEALSPSGTGSEEEASDVFKFDEQELGGEGQSPAKSERKAKDEAKKERNKRSARECRVRRKLREQYLAEQVAQLEKANLSLQNEDELLRFWAKELDEGRVHPELLEYREQVQLKEELDGKKEVEQERGKELPKKEKAEVKVRPSSK